MGFVRSDRRNGCVITDLTTINISEEGHVPYKRDDYKAKDKKGRV